MVALNQEAFNLHNLAGATGHNSRPLQRSCLSYSHRADSKRRIKMIETGKCSTLKAQIYDKDYRDAPSISSFLYFNPMIFFQKKQSCRSFHGVLYVTACL